MQPVCGVVEQAFEQENTVTPGAGTEIVPAPGFCLAVVGPVPVFRLLLVGEEELIGVRAVDVFGELLVSVPGL